VVPGSAPQSSGRFGDYSGAARDPADPSRVWLSAEIGQSTTGSPVEWGSGIAAVRVPPQAPAIVSTAAARGRVTAGIYAEGLPTTYRVEYGQTPAYGAHTPSGSLPATAREQPVAAAPAALLPGTSYHARIVATNSAGTTAGPDVVFTSPAAAPRVAYLAPFARGGLVTLRARVVSGGLPASVSFQYGATRAYGKRTARTRVSGTRTVSLRVRVTPGSLLHFRAVARNGKGTRTAPDRTARA
jgi:hypothetical protein